MPNEHLGKRRVFEPIRRVANRLSAIPDVYEWIQRLAGQEIVYRRIAQIWTADSTETVLDVGSSGGALTERLAAGAICVDIDLAPLARARRKRPSLRGVVADAARLPFRSGTFDHSLCVGVSHHLGDDSFKLALGELARVTRHTFVFLDAIRTERWISRLLWVLDRGSDPRERVELQAMLEQHFEIEGERVFKVLHQYVLWRATPRLRAG